MAESQVFLSIRCRALPASVFGAGVTHTTVSVAKVNPNGSTTEIDQTERLRDLANPAFQKQLVVSVKTPTAQRFRFTLHCHSGSAQENLAEATIAADELTADIDNELDVILTNPNDDHLQSALVQGMARIIIRASFVETATVFNPEQEQSILSEGRNVFVYSPDGSALVATLKYKPGFHKSGGLGALVWGPPGKPIPAGNEIEVADITDILEGKQSRSLMQHSARDVAEDTCFSIVSSSAAASNRGPRTFEISAESSAVRDVFLSHLHKLLTQGAGKEVSVMEKVNVIKSPVHKAPPPAAALGASALGGSFLTPASFRARDSQAQPVERQLTFQLRNLGQGFSSLVAVFDKQSSDVLYIDQTEVIRGQRDPNFKRSVFVQHYRGVHQEFKISVYEANETDLAAEDGALVDLSQRDVIGYCVIDADELATTRASLKYLTHSLESNRDWLQSQKTHVVVHCSADGVSSGPTQRTASKRDIHIRPSQLNLLAGASKTVSQFARPAVPQPPRVLTPLEVLRKGQDFIKFPAKAALLNEPEARRVFYAPDPKGKTKGHLYWCDTGRGNVMVRDRSLNVSKIVDVLVGKQTGPFKRGATAKGVSDKRCFSIIAGRTLDLAAPTEQIRDLWVSSLNALLSGTMQKPTLKSEESPLEPGAGRKQRYLAIKCRRLARVHAHAVNPTVVVFDARTGDSVARTERLVASESPDFVVPLVVSQTAGATFKFAVYDSPSDLIEGHDLLGHTTAFLDEIIAEGEAELMLVNDHDQQLNRALQSSQSSIVVRHLDDAKHAMPASAPTPVAPASPEVAVSVMKEGRPFTMFTSKGPQIVDVYYIPGRSGPGTLVWSEPQKRDAHPNPRQCIPLKDVSDVFEGKQRDNLNTKLTKGAVEENFFSVVAEESGLVWDLESATTYDRECFLEGINHLLSTAGVQGSVRDGAADTSVTVTPAADSADGAIKWSLLRNCNVTVYSPTGGAPQKGTLTFSTVGPSEARLGWLIAVFPGKNTIRIPLHEVTDLFEGRQTSAFKYAPASGAVDEHCFSVEAQKDILDIEASSKAERDSWVAGVHSLLSEGGKRFAEVKRDEAAAAQAAAAAVREEKSSINNLSVGESSLKQQMSPLPEGGQRYEGTPVRVHVTVKCKNLIKMDFLSKSDPLVAVNDVYTGRLLAQTEWLEDTFDPDFETGLPLDYYRDQDQLLKFVVYDVDNNQITENGRMGYAIVNMDELMSQPSGKALEKQLTFPEKPQLEKKLFLNASTIIISTEPQ